MASSKTIIASVSCGVVSVWAQNQVVCRFKLNYIQHSYNLVQTRWDTCSTNHHYVHNQDVCVQNDMYDSISMF